MIVTKKKLKKKISLTLLYKNAWSNIKSRVCIRRGVVIVRQKERIWALTPRR